MCHLVTLDQSRDGGVEYSRPDIRGAFCGCDMIGVAVYAGGGDAGGPGVVVGGEGGGVRVGWSARMDVMRRAVVRRE